MLLQLAEFFVWFYFCTALYYAKNHVKFTAKL